MCNCKATVETKIAAMYAAEGRTGLKATLQGYGTLLAGDNLLVKPFTEAKVDWVQPGKSGDIRKRRSVDVYFTHCPFCGAKLDQALPATIGQPEPAFPEPTATAPAGAKATTKATKEQK